MARRAGKAANRKARQRSAAQRAAPVPQRRRPPPPRRRFHRSAPPTRAKPSRSTRRSRVSPARLAAVGSTLTAAERPEYHYVERDLRNIGILTAVMAVLLFLAWVAFSALGLVG